MHIGGVDCFTQNSIEKKFEANDSDTPQLNHSIANHTKDLSSIKTLLIVTISILSTILVICNVSIIYKYVIERPMKYGSSENIVVTYNENNLNRMA